MVHPVFHISLLRRFVPDPIEGRRPRPPPAPVVVNGQPEWIVESVENSRFYRNNLQFFVKWKGFTRENNSWEPAENLENAKRAVRDFYTRFPGADR